MINPQYIKNISLMFQNLYGVDVEIEDFNDEDKDSFVTLINSLDAAVDIEVSLPLPAEPTEKDIEKMVNGNKLVKDLSDLSSYLWGVVDFLIEKMFTPKVKELIEWYLYERIDEWGEVVPYIDEEGEEIIFNTPDDLYYYSRSLYFSDK